MDHGDPSFNLTAPRHLDLWGRVEYHGWVVTPGPLDTDCWIFEQGSKRRRGYGCVTKSNKTYLAHRVSFEHHFGQIPHGLLVRHRCDTPMCINPDHLLTGTVKDNTRDMLERGRGNPPKGSVNGRSVLTEDEVYEILERRFKLGYSLKKIAVEYGISISNTCLICTGTSWKDVYKKWVLDNVQFGDKKTNE